MSDQTKALRRHRPELSSVRVRVVEGPDEGRALTASQAMTVGTAPSTDLTLSDPTVSRFHLELRADPAGIRVRDLDSLNGTMVGTLSLSEAVVSPATRLRIGDTLIEVSDGDLNDDRYDTERPTVPGLVYRSDAMAAIARSLIQLGPSDVSVLIRGETGTGKERVAEALHALSPRRGAFEVVDCGSLPPTLVASELFGHERGAFTGADRQHQGAFERARGGTLFLDEIGELPIKLQPVLLGVLERGRFRRVGGKGMLEADVRVVCATHRDLRRAVNDGSFRADLYYRLAAAELLIPPLRERKDDIPELIRHFLLESTGHTDATLFGDKAMSALRTQRWSGNVRELRNVVEHALALGSLPQTTVPAAEHLDAAEEHELHPYRDARQRVLEEFERRYLGQLLSLSGGNVSKASREARMDRSYLISLLRKHDLR